jgi:predicted 3-demethylubiquinone-9 3-methyltransferase (glyoxalase superfamily)
VLSQGLPVAHEGYASAPVEPVAMPTITPFLWFDDQAEEAMLFYTSIFKGSKPGDVSRSDDGHTTSATFELNGQRLIAFNGGPHFTFSPAISLFVNCETQEQIDELWEKLSEGGEKQRCGWVKDKFGLSWQIVPSILGDLLNDDDDEKAERTRAAMLAMTKLDINGLKRAHAG